MSSPATLDVVALPANASVPAVLPQRSHHLPELDALRGLAAVVVVLSHFARLWDASELSHRTRILLDQVFLPLVNGRSSVTLFFLLSGFVLTLPYKRGKGLPYATFFLRRLARIYFPYLVALVLALLGDWVLQDPIHISPWFSQTWTAPLTPSLILQHLLLIGSYDTAQVNTAFWSLAIEMRLSIVFPLLCIPLLRWRRPFALTLLGALLLLDVAIPHFLTQHLATIPLDNLTDTTLGVVSFAFGILLARRLEPLQEIWHRLPRASRLLLATLSFGLLEWSGNLLHTPLWILVNLLSIAGGCGVLLVTLCSQRASVLLNHRLPAWLGRISYSLYLVHATVLFALVHLFNGYITRSELFLPYLACAFGLAVLFFFAVERPSIQLSRNFHVKTRPRVLQMPTSEFDLHASADATRAPAAARALASRRSQVG